MTPDHFDRLTAAYVPFVAPWVEIDPDARLCDVEGPHPFWQNEAAAIGLSVEDGPLERGTWAAVTGWGLGDSADVEKLMRAAQAALRPGGLLILTGPNPERHGHIAPTSWADSLTQKFVAAGFKRVRQLRLNGIPRPGQIAPSMRDIFCNASPDIGVIGQMPWSEAAMHNFYPAFAAPTGKNVLDTLADYDRSHIQERYTGLSHRYATLSDQYQHLSRQQATFQADWQRTLQDIHHRLDEMYEAQDGRIMDLERRLARATRRRGLRRLAELFRNWRRARRDRRHDHADQDPSAPPEMVHNPQPTAPQTPPSESPRPSYPAMPLSERETAIADRLKGERGA